MPSCGKPWWCHDMGPLSTLLALYEGNPLVVDYSHKEPLLQSLDVFFVVSQKKLLICRWLEVPWSSCQWCDCKFTQDLMLLSVFCWKHVCLASISACTHHQLKWSCFEDFPDSKDSNMGPTGPRWAPCWPHELCHLVSHSLLQESMMPSINDTSLTTAAWF